MSNHPTPHHQPHEELGLGCRHLAPGTWHLAPGNWHLSNDGQHLVEADRVTRLNPYLDEFPVDGGW